MIIAVGIFLILCSPSCLYLYLEIRLGLTPLCAIPISTSHYHRTADKSHLVTFSCHVFQIHWGNPLRGQRNAILKELIKIYLTNLILQTWGHS